MTPSTHTPPPDASAQRVLVVEDLPDARDSLQTLLQIALKVEVDAAEDGGQALAMLSQRPYSLIVTDLKMPKINGMRLLREVRMQKTEAVAPYTVGQVLTADIFSPGEYVDVVGVTKGKGFQGGVKRHGWSGGDATHGSMFHRAPGSIGASSDPSRVWPGHPLPGRMGGDRRTVLNLPVVRVMAEQNLLLLRGAVPGARGGFLMVRKSVKQTKAQQQKAQGAK